MQESNNSFGFYFLGSRFFLLRQFLVRSRYPSISSQSAYFDVFVWLQPYITHHFLFGVRIKCIKYVSSLKSHAKPSQATQEIKNSDWMWKKWSEFNRERTNEREKKVCTKIKHKLSIIFIFMLLLWFVQCSTANCLSWLCFALILLCYSVILKRVVLFSFSFFPVWIASVRCVSLCSQNRDCRMREQEKRPMSKNSDQVVNWTEIKC